MLKKMSLRERIMAIVLAAIVVYYLGVQLPVSSMTEKIETEQAEVTAQLETNQDKILMKSQMEKKLREYKASGSKTHITPSYDNTNNIITEMNTVLGGATNYTITFGDVTKEKHIVRRAIDLQFTADSYYDAVKKLRKLENSRNAYLLNDTSITRNANAGATTDCTVVVNLTSFEYAE